MELEPQKVLHLHLEEAKRKPKIQGDYLVTEKLDGIYGFIDYSITTGWGSITSRQNRVIPSLIHARDYFLPMRPKHNCRFIFEVTIPGVDFHIANGILNRSVGDCQAYGAVLNLHDIILPDYYNLYNVERWELLNEVDIDHSVKLVKIPLLAVSDKKEVWMHYSNQVWEKGGEGIVLKEARGKYQSGKRNSSLMKIKLEEKVNLRCIDYFYTTGDKGNTNLNATMIGEDGIKSVVRIGKHSDIAEIEKDSSYILGQLCEIKCMCKLPSGQLREPRFSKVL
jgi:hypothetical protein